MSLPPPPPAPAPPAADAEHAAHQRALFTALPDLVWLKDPDGVYLACNRRFEQFFGATEAQILGRTDADFVSAELAEFFRANDRRAMARNAPTVNEELLTFPDDGHQELTQTIKTPVRDEQGRLLGVLGIGRDITALRRAEDEYRQLFDRNPAPSLIYRQDTLAILAANQAFCQSFGVPADEVLQLHFDDLYPEDEREALRLRARLASGMLRTGERRLVRRDGQALQMLVQGHDILRDGQPCRLVVLTDITALKAAEAALAHERSLLRNERDRLRLTQFAMDQAADMVFWLRRDGYIAYANDAACRFVGLPRRSLLALPGEEVCRDWSREALAGQAQGQGRGRGVEVLDSELITGDGRLRPVELRLSQFRAGDDDYLFAFVTDISLRLRTQQRERSRLALLENLARGDELSSLLDQLLRGHEALFAGSLCSVMLVDEDDDAGGRRRLRSAAGPSLPAEFLQAIDGLAVAEGNGACGAAAASGQRVLVDDIASHPNMAAYVGLASRYQLGACWSEPIIGGQGRVLGTFAVYRRQPGPASDEELAQLSFEAQLAALAIGHAQTTRALRTSEGRLKNLLRAIPDLVWLKDTQGIYRACNAAFERLLDRDESQILGRGDADFIGAEAAAELGEREARIVAGAQAVTEERWLVNARDGQRGLYEIVRTPLFGEDGQALGVLGVARDITLLRQGAQAIGERQRLIDTMFGQTTDAIALIDPVTQRFVTFNDAACIGLGYEREVFAGMTPRDIQLEHDAQTTQANLRAVIAGETLRFTTRHRRGDAQGGGEQVADVTLRAVTFEGRRLVSAVWRDITEERQRELRIGRLNQTYAVLSAVNEAIARGRDGPTQLFAEVCRITVEIGGFALAWVGGLHPHSGVLVPLTHAGLGDDYLQALQQGNQVAPGPAATAVATGQVCVFNDVEREAPPMPLRDLALARGLRAMAAFPIATGGQVHHALVVHSHTIGHFDAELLALFTRLAGNVGFALDFDAAERAQRQAQHFREQLVESVAGLFFAIDQRGRVVQWNHRVLEVTGYDADELRRRRVTEFFDATDAQLIQQRLEYAFASGEAQVEAAVITRDGRRLPHLFVARRLDGAEQPLVVGTAIDISERVRSEQELARHRQQLEDLVASRTAALAEANARMAREDRRLRAMLALNQRAGAWDEQELLQLGISEACALSGSGAGRLELMAEDADATMAGPRLAASHGADATLVDAAWLQALCRRAAQGQAELVEAGPAQPAAALAVPVFDGARLCAVLAVAGREQAYDEADARELALIGGDLWRVIRRRRIEIALEQAKRDADAASQAKSAFLANMSHEIRTPMNAIVGFAHLLRRDPLTPRQVDHLAKITDASQHLLQVINDILDFSKIEAHKVTLDEADFALRESVNRVSAMLVDRARAKDVALTVVLRDCPAHLHGDRLRLEQVLLNLVGNAVKFTHRGRIELRVFPVPLQPGLAPAGAPHRLRFEVADTGIGIAAEQVPHLFEPFEQADASTTRRFGGTGLGLAISKRLTELMGGRIGVQSQLGQGSLFWIELPLRGALATPRPALAAPLLPPSAPLPAAGLAGRLQGLRVLLAEDNAINQEVASSLLHALGLQVDLAADGETAVRLAGERRYDLILMDVQMPVLDGLRATAAIRRLPGGADLPIVAMTANAFDEDRAACLAAGMNDYLAKPVEPQQLGRCLATWLYRAAPAAAADPEAALQQRLRQVPGLDLALGLTRVNGHLALYLRALRLFVSHHGPDVARLAAMLQDWSDGSGEGVGEGAGEAARPWRGIAHSVAGAAATLGAQPLTRLAHEAELAAAGPAGRAAVAALQQALAELLQWLQQALEPAPPPAPVSDAAEAEAAASPPSAAERAAARLALDGLRPLLVSHDTAAGEQFERVQPLLLRVLGEAARQLGQQLQAFSFSEALAVLDQALQRLPPPD
ncbi:MAG: PAS domain S-box protein [Burkholderiaceae bacterium]|nr:PAS domain S-box protein [Burkholderiaceae bacterium]